MVDPLPDAIPAFTLMAIYISMFAQSAALVTGIIAIVVLILISAGSSASETAFFSLTPSQLNEIRSVRTATNKRITHLLDNPKLLLATILITNNLVNVGIVIISTFLSNRYLDFSGNPLLGILFQVVVITSVLLLLGEILPKVLATRQAVKIASITALPLTLVQQIMLPFSRLLVNSTRFIDKKQAKNHNITLDDISNAIDITADGKVDAEDRKIMKSITRFGEINAREIMSPRVDLTLLALSLSFDKVKKTILDSGYSRIPVYEETPDTITGILYIKDLLPYLSENETFAWQQLIRQPFFVPENKPINDLMQEFREKKIHMAVVVDEYGGTSGIITLEDIIEEIVGEINDEFDVDADSEFYSKIDEENYLFEGKTSLNDMCRVLGIDNRMFDDAKGESETLAGVILEYAGKLPSAGESFSINGYLFRIVAADKRRIKKVKITMPVSHSDDNTNG